jgi:hypothetical protein
MYNSKQIFPIEYKTQNQTAVAETTKRGEKKTLTNSDSRKTEQIETDLISIIKGHVRQITAAQTTKQNIHKTKQKN